MTRSHSGTALEGVMAVQPLPPQPPTDRKDRTTFIDAYVREVQTINEVIEVLVRDNLTFLDIYTVYRGDLKTVEHAIYDAELRATDRCPHVRVDFHLVSNDFSVLDAVRASAQAVFSRV